VRANRLALQTVDSYRDQFILGNDSVYCGKEMAQFNPGKLEKIPDPRRYITGQ